MALPIKNGYYNIFHTNKYSIKQHERHIHIDHVVEFNGGTYYICSICGRIKVERDVNQYAFQLDDGTSFIKE
jgi:hypothetical protein